MAKVSSGDHSRRGISTTRGSWRNWLRKALTAAVVGAAGVPRLTSKIPVFVVTLASCRSIFVVLVLMQQRALDGPFLQAVLSTDNGQT
ncbi:hypothetical protein D3C79_756950 [compost metagenome]